MEPEQYILLPNGQKKPYTGSEAQLAFLSANPNVKVVEALDYSALNEIIPEFKETPSETVQQTSNVIKNAPSNFDLYDLGGMIAPLVADELENHGLSRPGMLVTKGVGDAAMTAVPPTKAIGIGLRAGKAGKRLNKVGNVIMSPYETANKWGRVGGQAVTNSADNLINQGIVAAVDDAEHEISEAGIGLGMGALTGGLAGGYNAWKVAPFKSELARKAKTGAGGKIEQNYDMRKRFGNTDAESNFEMAEEVVRKYGLQQSAVPKDINNILKDLEADIADAQHIMIARQKSMHGVTGSPLDVSPVKPTFKSTTAENKWRKEINDFLVHNDLGTFKGNTIVFDDGMNYTDLEGALKKLNEGQFKSASDKNFAETLRKAARNESNAEAYVAGMPDDGSYGAARAHTEMLQRDKKILELIQAGYGYDDPAWIFMSDNWKPSHRPGIGLMEGPKPTVPGILEVKPRAAAQIGTQAIIDYDEVKNLYDSYQNE